MPFNILRNADIRNDMSCRHDNNDGWAVVWDEDNDFKQYTAFSEISGRGVWDKRYFFVTTSGSCYVGPATDQVAFDGSIYNTLKVTFRIEKGNNTSIEPTTGRIQYQTDNDPSYSDDKTVDFSITPDNAYNEYIIDMSQERNWVGEITRIRFYPFIDGAAGYIIHLKSIAAQATSVFTCDTGYLGTVCNRYSQYVHPCPWVGSGGSSTGVEISNGIDIVQGVNDKLIVNINGYGNQGITLNPIKGARIKDIARDIEDKISNIGIGGYAGVRVDVDLNKITITADDTREESSTVVIGDTTLARQLGFYDDEGSSISTDSSGEEAASRYEPAGTKQLSKSELAHFYQPDPAVIDVGVELDTRRYSIQGGRSDYALVYKDQKVDFTDKTIIDFNNPINNSGIITRVAYSGDGTSTTEFRIFRPSADGTITHVYSIDMELSGDEDDRVFEQDTNIRVRKGDYLGVYNGRIDLGITEEIPNGSYFIYDGNLTNGASIQGPSEITSRGETGLRLFARGSDFETEVVVDIEFENPELLETITVYAEEEERTEEVNLSQLRSGGIGGGISISTETGVDKFGDPAPAMTDVAALIDGIKHVEPNADNLHPVWLDSPFTPADKFDQTEIAITLDFAKGVPVFFDINRVVIYFRDVNNVKYFSLEYPITTDETDTFQYWGPVADFYNEVYMEGDLVSPTDHPLYENPIHPTVVNFVDSYQVLEYRVLEFKFDAVKARSLRYNIKNYYYEDDVTKSTLSNFVLAPSPRIMEIEVYADSTPVAAIADNFEFESSNDGENYITHTRVESTGVNNADYLIGYPVQYLRARIKPQGKLNFRSFSITTSESLTDVKVNSNTGDLSLNVARDNFEEYETVKVTNNTNSTYNFYVDISPQRSTIERCILWNKLSDDSTTSVSEIGPSPSVWKRSNFTPRTYNYALNAPGYVVDPFWLVNLGAVCYISYDGGGEWLPRGNTLTDYNLSTKLTSINPEGTSSIFVYVLVDLGAVYSLETVQIVNNFGATSFTGPFYSNKNVSDPSDLDISNDFSGAKEDVRWMLFNSFSRDVSVSDPEEICYLRLSLDVLDHRNSRKVPWVEVSKLTNYVSSDSFGNNCGEGWQCLDSGFTNWYAVDLEDHYNITNLIVGPALGGFSSQDVDTLEPGGTGSVYTSSSKSNSNITYSSSNTADPVKVNWGFLGDEPSSKDRWILIRSPSAVKDEVIVHIEDNVQEDKPAFGSERWWSYTLSPVYKDRINFITPFYSMAVDYAADTGTSLETIEFTQSWGTDYDLAKRDQLRIWFYVSDASQFDFSQGHIALGRNTTENNSGISPLAGTEKDTENYFQWDFSELESLISTGWNELFLPFSDNFRIGSPFFERDDLENLSADDITGRKRMRWFRIQFAGIEGNKEFTVSVDDPEVVRADYTPAKFGNALYLTGNEYAKFPLHNFNTLEGTIEFYLNSEWTKDRACLNCDDPRDHTLFRFFNIDGYLLGGFMTGQGLRIYLNDGDGNHYFLTDNANRTILPGVDTHIAVTWDLRAKRSRDALRVYINGILSAAFEQEGLDGSSFTTNPNATLLLGATAWAGLIERRAGAVDGTIENIRVYNFAKNDFSQSLTEQDPDYLRAPEELIEVSVDGVNFYGSQNRGSGLPLLIQNVSAGSSFNVYVRHRDTGVENPKRGQERTTYLEILRALAG